MRLLFLGGTGPVGAAARRVAAEHAHECVVAHSGAHEESAAPEAEHVHAVRDELLRDGGPLAALHADVLVDTRTKAESAGAVLGLARTVGARRVVLVSSTDVYQLFSDAGREDPVLLVRQRIPIDESDELRTAPYPWAPPGHDNAAMERAVRGAAARGEAIALLRPGMIYGPGEAWREWTIVRRAKAGTRRIELPDFGAQIFSRAALERVGRAVVAAAERAPVGVWPVNVVDPYGWSYAGLVAEIGALLEWKWEPVAVAYDQARHPFKLRSPYLCSDRRLREELGVTDPDPRAALAETILWLWAHGEERYADDPRIRAFDAAG